MESLVKLFKSLEAKTSATPFGVAEVATAEMVHNEFYHACDGIAEQAKMDKAAARRSDRLRKLGFTQMDEVLEAKQTRRLQKIAETIAKYAVSRPNNKVISGEEVERINNKYGLVLADVSQYKGTMPEKNLLEIEKFKAPKVEEEGIFLTSGLWGTITIGGPTAEVEPAPKVKLKICCPAVDVKLRANERLEGNKIIVTDPIVLFKVENNCYLIVTAWGEEAKEVNEKLN